MVLLGACSVGAVEEDLDDEVDRTMLARVARYPDMQPINTRPIASELGAFQIDCYAQGDVAGYRRIHPETTGTNIRVEPGTVIVRAVLAPDSRPAKLTAMGKGPPGFDPTFGDWWFAVTDPRGEPLEDDGELQIGRLETCHECHRDRARDDFLFGVPATAL